MSSKGRRGELPQFIWDSYRAMSVDVGRLYPFFRETACMHYEERKMIAYMKGFVNMFGDDPELADFVVFLEDYAIPFFQDLGRAKWNRDVVTDLGFAKSKQRTRRAKVEGLLTFEPKKVLANVPKDK